MAQPIIHLAETAQTVSRDKDYSIRVPPVSQPDELAVLFGKVDFVAPVTANVFADSRLLRIVMDNLLRNAWKYTSQHDHARIEFGQISKNGQTTNFVKDDGSGFDPRSTDRLFQPFQRLHSAAEFPGSGIGLATVKRIVQRHGGEVWAEGEIEEGVTFYFTLEALVAMSSERGIPGNVSPQKDRT